MIRLFKKRLAALCLSICLVSLNLWANNNAPVRFIKTDQKVVALTFDDGPSKPYTEQILAILDKHNVKATFYLLGVSIKSYPEIVKQTIKSGHELGNHSMYHKKLKNKNADSIAREVSNVDELIKKMGYTKELTFRSPYGQVSPSIQQAMDKLGKKNVLFSYLPKDWEGPAAKVIHDRIMTRVRPGFIITLHDGGKRRQTTVEATEMLIESLQSQGYRFVTITELLSMGPAVHVYH
tara:strand:+ start:36500 stop:37207 length:708 start_codon:yes stop_codon:yes gene_type:complete